MNETATNFASVADLEAYLETMAGVPGEMPGLSELDHGLQCAAELKVMVPDDIELQVAGLVHDISHGQVHIRDHGAQGAAAVRLLLGERVAALVQRHVTAKRYLISLDPDYLAKISFTSMETFLLQGGLMSPEEITAFAADPHCEDAILLRIADDAAKMPGRDVPKLDSWRDALRSVAAGGCRALQ